MYRSVFRVPLRRPVTDCGHPSLYIKVVCPQFETAVRFTNPFKCYNCIHIEVFRFEF